MPCASQKVFYDAKNYAISHKAYNLIRALTRIACDKWRIKNLNVGSKPFRSRDIIVVYYSDEPTYFFFLYLIDLLVLLMMGLLIAIYLRRLVIHDILSNSWIHYEGPDAYRAHSLKIQ